ncbi:MAG: hypothetical protein ACKVJE_14070 [Pseudomonadales bacterium]
MDKLDELAGALFRVIIYILAVILIFVVIPEYFHLFNSWILGLTQTHILITTLGVIGAIYLDVLFRKFTIVRKETVEVS